ncbi:MAG: hypothetical protein NW223_08230 [Hyphomicrobiaceae bacterium]|nr:hypothetical protein [Hyphomicrobiaceae bacterium]
MTEPAQARGHLSTMGLLRLWLWGSAAVVVVLLIWAIAPVLFLLLALTAGLGLVSAAVVKLARLIEARYGGSDGDDTP